MATADQGLAATVLETTRVRALASSPDVYELARTLPSRPEGGPGRPNQFPDFVWVLFAGMTGIFGSARKTAAAMTDPVYWHLIREGVARCLGPAEALALPPRGPSRNQWNYHSRRLHTQLPRMQETFRDLAAAQALAAGYAHDDGHHPIALPPRERFVVGDGTVVASPLRKTATRKAKKKRKAKTPDQPVRRRKSRRDPGAGWHYEGGEEEDGGHPVFGPKFVHLSVRGDRPLSRIILDMRYQPPGGGYGGEAAIAVTMTTDAVRRLPGLLGVCWDGALRGKHRDTLMKAGLQVVSPQHDGIQPRRLDPITTCPCSRQHDLWAQDGAVHEAEILDTGDLHRTRCPILRPERRGRTGRTRWYHLIRLSCGNAHRIRLDTTPDDTRREFNRAEHLRQHPPDTDGYIHCYRWRPDAESLNAQLDATLWNRRMIAYGAAQQTLIMLGFAIAQNALTRHLHQRATDHGSQAAA
ncbi:hypothetical protein CTZ27_17870 [Streptomyces griseocarneus]|nr:hypothetical protein CTZ27_17870 [Streptomyces griseocarneus]